MLVNPPIRQSANPLIRQSANPPIRQFFTAAHHFFQPFTQRRVFSETVICW